MEKYYPKTYKEAGVDNKKAERFISRIKEKVTRTYGPRVIEGVGGFCSLYEIGKDKYLSAGTDGVGTKLELAKLLGRHTTIGIDLVAMCANDIICSGSRPLFFMDYLATGKLDEQISEDILTGIVNACQESEMALIGGETAEMPGLYKEGDYDLAGFAVGEVERDKVLNGKNMEEGDEIIGLSSSGFHSNGYSLLRKVIKPEEKDYCHQLLTPTRLYWPIIKSCLDLEGAPIKGLAHITGGGWSNLLRVNKDFDYHITKIPSFDEIPPLFSIVSEKLKMPFTEFLDTFNGGVGMMMVVKPNSKIKKFLHSCGEVFWSLGHVKRGLPGKGRLVYERPLR